MTSRTLALLTSSLLSLVLASACASDTSFPASGSPDASLDGATTGYCPAQGTAKGCLLSNNTCGLDYGMGCVAKGTTYGAP